MFGTSCTSRGGERGYCTLPMHMLRELRNSRHGIGCSDLTVSFNRVRLIPSIICLEFASSTATALVLRYQTLDKAVLVATGILKPAVQTSRPLQTQSKTLTGIAADVRPQKAAWQLLSSSAQPIQTRPGLQSGRFRVNSSAVVGAGWETWDLVDRPPPSSHSNVPSEIYQRPTTGRV